MRLYILKLHGFYEKESYIFTAENMKDAKDKFENEFDQGKSHLYGSSCYKKECWSDEEDAFGEDVLTFDIEEVGENIQGFHEVLSFSE